MGKNELHDKVQNLVAATEKATKCEMVRRFMELIPHTSDKDLNKNGKLELDPQALADFLKQIQKEVE